MISVTHYLRKYGVAIESGAGRFTVKYGGEAETYLEDQMGSNQTQFEHAIAAKYSFLLPSAPTGRGSKQLTSKLINEFVCSFTADTFKQRLELAFASVKKLYAMEEGKVVEFALAMVDGGDADCVKFKGVVQLKALQAIYPEGKAMDGLFYVKAPMEYAPTDGVLKFLDTAEEVSVSEEKTPTKCVMEVPSCDSMFNLKWMNDDLNKLPTEERQRILWVDPVYESMFSAKTKKKFFPMLPEGPLVPTEFITEAITNYGKYMDSIPSEHQVPFMIGRILSYKGQMDFTGGKLFKLKC